MPQMCGLKGSVPKGEMIYINPLQVRFIRPSSAGNTLIVFDADRSTIVAAELEQTRSLLDLAINTPT
jgi:hypothetical protein